jgi:hypothetical protein
MAKIHELIEGEKDVKVQVNVEIKVLWLHPPKDDADKMRRDMIQRTFNEQARDVARSLHDIITGKEKPNIIIRGS